MIDYPCRNGYCEKCIHQDIDGNCNRIKLGLSQVPCVQVACCKGYKPIAGGYVGEYADMPTS